MELYADEAQYWLWSTTPDIGYYSKPPMIAWIIWLTTRFGDSEFYLRLASPIIYSLTGSVVYLITNRITSKPQLAFISGLCFLTLPAITVGSMLITTDAPLLLFWALCLYALVIAENKAWQWLLIGIMAGIGMVSKSTMLLFLPIGLWWLWLQIRVKGQLSSYVPRGIFWIILASLTLYLPSFYWIVTHKMSTVRHVTTLVLGDFGWGNLAQGIIFFLAQFLVAGPILFAYFCYAIWHRRSKIEDASYEHLLYLLTVVPVLLTTVIGMSSKAYANWAAPAYISFSVILAMIGGVWLVRGIAFNTVVSVMIMLLPIAVHQLEGYGVDLGKLNPLKRVEGGHNLTDAVMKAQQYYGTDMKLDLVSDDRKELVLLSYYGRSNLAEGVHPLNVQKWNPEHELRDHFDLVGDLNAVRGHTLMLASRHLTLAQVQYYAPQAILYKQLKIRYTGKEQEYSLYLIENFEGY